MDWRLEDVSNVLIEEIELLEHIQSVRHDEGVV